MAELTDDAVSMHIYACMPALLSFTAHVPLSVIFTVFHIVE